MHQETSKEKKKSPNSRGGLGYFILYVLKQSYFHFEISKSKVNKTSIFLYHIYTYVGYLYPNLFRLCVFLMSLSNVFVIVDFLYIPLVIFRIK